MMRIINWAQVLYGLSLLSFLISLASIFYIASSQQAPIVLTHGSDVWSIAISDLSSVDRMVIVFAIISSEIFWLYIVLQIYQLACAFREDKIFILSNANCLINIGHGLLGMAVFSVASYPFIAFYLNFVDLAPWVADIPALFLLDPSLLLSSIFFYALGNVMKHGVLLYETDKMTI